MAGCIHKTTSVTPWERVTTDNALLAQFANTAEQGTELAVTSGLMSTATARPIITFEAQFADAHKKITAILAAGPETADLAGAKAILDVLNTQAQVLVASGDIGIRNPKTQQTISGDIRNIIALTEALISDIQLIHGGVK